MLPFNLFYFISISNLNICLGLRMKFLRRSLHLEHGWMILRRYFRSTFIASRYNYMINNECLLWFQDPTPLICGFYNPLSGISSSTVYHIFSLRLTSKEWWLIVCLFFYFNFFPLVIKSQYLNILLVLIGPLGF